MTESAPTWAVVIVNYNAGDLLTECIGSLLADRSAGVVEIVVVDNGSTDGSVTELRAAVPGVSVIEPRANLGYARAANLGIASTRAPVVAVGNPDTLLAAGSAAAVLAAFAADPVLAVVGPRILNPDGTVYPSARTAPGLGTALGHAALSGIWPSNRFTARYRQSDADPTRAREVDWVSGAMLWFRRSWLDRIGGWDERFFLFLEDVDVCRSISAAGGRVRYEPAATVTHVVGASRAANPTGSIVAHHRSAYRYVAKWWAGPRRALLPAAAVFLTARATVEISAGALGRRASQSAGGERIA